MIVRRRDRRRRGATIVEAALTLAIFCMFMFGVFEYGRYLLVLQVATNAARDGARYATVNVREEYNFDTTGASGKPSIQQYVGWRMAGTSGMLGPTYKVEVYPCDPAGLYALTPVANPKTGWGPDPATRSVHWNSATFTERIGVRITGVYKPVLPGLLFMDDAIDFKVVAVMGSEG